MNRNEKRSTLFKLNKDIRKFKAGKMTVQEIAAMDKRIKALQAAGILKKRQGFWKRLFKKIFGK